MGRDYLFDWIPVWGVFVVTTLTVMISVKLGNVLGRRRGGTPGGWPEGPMGTVIGATLTLLGFLIAVSFGAAASNFDKRRQGLLDETNAIGTCYLRAGLLPELHRGEVRKLLRQYVDIRVEAPRHPEKLPELIRRSEELHSQLWAHAEVLVAAGHQSEIDALFVESLNAVIDMHSVRVSAALWYRVPVAFWWSAWMIMALASALLGRQFGLAGRSSLWPGLALAVSFAVAITVTADIDRPGGGWIRVGQQGMLDLQRSLAEPTP